MVNIKIMAIDFTTLKERTAKRAEERSKEFRVIIVGGRHFDNYELLNKKCDFYLKVKSVNYEKIK